MKGKLILAPNDEMELFDYNLNLGVHPFDYEISINTDLSDNFVSLISTTGDLEESIETSIELTDNQSCIDFYSKCKSNLPELLKNAEYVVFGFEIDEISKCIYEMISSTIIFVFCGCPILPCYNFINCDCIIFGRLCKNA